MADSKKITKRSTKTTASSKENPKLSVTEAAIDAAKEVAEVVHEKRSTGRKSKLTTESAAAYDKTLSDVAEDNSTNEEPQVDIDTTAKAGKRSTKAQREAKAEAERQERKQQTASKDETTPKPPSKPARTRLERRSKKFRDSAKLIETHKSYELSEAVDLAKKTSLVKFDATVELHVNLNVDPRHADQNIRDNLVLPAGTGKKVRVAVVTADPKEALSAGADLAGNEELLAQFDKGIMDFDILIATPSLMPKLGKYARTLGPRGLMPNPKSGTVTTEVNRAVAEAKAGRVEYRVDSTGIIHLGIGKVSFSQTELQSNADAILTSIKNNKPSSVKNNYIKAVHLTTTMGPSINVNLASVN